MKIDIKWALPFIMPFALLLVIKLLWWVAGADLNHGVAALVSMVFGVLSGLIIAIVMSIEGINLNIRVKDFRRT